VGQFRQFKLKINVILPKFHLVFEGWALKYSKRLGTIVIAAAVAMMVLAAWANVAIVLSNGLTRVETFNLIWPLTLASSVAVILVMSVLYETLCDLVLQLEKQKDLARSVALQDALTGVSNRTLLMDRLEQALRQKKRDDVQVALLIIDLDRFKSVNDTFGHDVGDQVIREAASRFKNRLRDVDTLARIGGDEFAVLLSSVSGSAGAEKACQDLLSGISDVFQYSGKKIHLGASIGAVLADAEDTAADLMQKADIAMYKAKKGGRNQYKLFSSNMNIAAKRRRQIEEHLRLALSTGDGLDVHFQPIMAKDQSIISVEGFLRWTNESFGSISPGEAIPIAEECGLIDEIGAFVIEQCCDVAHRFPEITLSINLSSLQFRDQSLSWRIEQQIKNSGLSCSRFELEITEKLLIDQSPEFVENLGKLRKAGFRIALDDFGTGYSSLNCLHELAIDTLKLDSTFVASAKRNHSIALLRSAVALGHANGMQVIAEGVSNEGHREIAFMSGCDGMQGHLIAAPMERRELANFFDSHPQQRSEVA